MDLSETLLQSIENRTQALRARVFDLRSAVPDDRLAIASVLDLFDFFPDALEHVVQQEWTRNPLSISRIQLLRPLLRHATDVASFVDEWLTHTDTSVVPLYLLDAIERASSELGLGDRKAVIAAGRADNFTTVVADLDQLLFTKLGPLCPPVPSHLLRKFSLMRAPRFEGRVALWHPIILGHEISHIVVGVKDSLSTLNLQSNFDFARAQTLEVPGSATPGLAAAFRLVEIGESWAEELLCDAYAVHKFGASGVSALAEYLEVIGATDHLSDTHPPGRLRVRLLIRWLGGTTNSRVGELIKPWQDLACEPIAYSESWAQFLVDELLSRADDIQHIVSLWSSDPYDCDARKEVIEAASNSLQIGVPPEITVNCPGVRHEVTMPDIILAAWIGRIERFETPIDRLAEKSLSDLEFIRRWGTAGGSLPIPQVYETEISTETHTLSAEEITHRLYCQSDRRLIATPLLPDFASGSSLDLRLSNGFIVFVRSGTESFDPLNQDRNPRQVQRFKQLAWGDKFVLHPHELVLAATLEYLVLPADLTAQVISRSSYGRLGLLSATAVQVHPHFHGCLTLELVNLGTVPLVLTPGERIAQLVISPTGSIPTPPVRKYHCPIGPEFSKVRADAEASVLNHLDDPLSI